jgi:hypothetical protein
MNKNFESKTCQVHPFCNLQSLARTHAVLVICLYELLGNPTTELIEPPRTCRARTHAVLVIGLYELLVNPATKNKGNDTDLKYRVSEWLLFNANSAIFQLYHGENKLFFNDMMIRSIIFKEWRVIVLFVL